VRAAAADGGVPAPPNYPRDMLPGTGSPVLDLVLEAGIIAVMLVTIVLLIKNYRGR
jgi:hypothetical protein